MFFLTVTYKHTIVCNAFSSLPMKNDFYGLHTTLHFVPTVFYVNGKWVKSPCWKWSKINKATNVLMISNAQWHRATFSQPFRAIALTLSTVTPRFLSGGFSTGGVPLISYLVYSEFFCTCFLLVNMTSINVWSHVNKVKTFRNVIYIQYGKGQYCSNAGNWS